MALSSYRSCELYLINFGIIDDQDFNAQCSKNNVDQDLANYIPRSNPATHLILKIKFY